MYDVLKFRERLAGSANPPIEFLLESDPRRVVGAKVVNHLRWEEDPRVFPFERVLLSGEEGAWAANIFEEGRLWARLPVLFREGEEALSGGKAPSDAIEKASGACEWGPRGRVVIEFERKDPSLVPLTVDFYSNSDLNADDLPLLLRRLALSMKRPSLFLSCNPPALLDIPAWKVGDAALARRLVLGSGRGRARVALKPSGDFFVEAGEENLKFANFRRSTELGSMVESLRGDPEELLERADALYTLPTGATYQEKSP